MKSSKNDLCSSLLPACFLGIVLLFFTTCFSPLDYVSDDEDEWNDGVTRLVITLPGGNSNSRNLMGNSIMGYDLLFEGPGGKSFTERATGGDTVGVEVVPGLWSVKVRLYSPSTNTIDEAKGEVLNFNVKEGVPNKPLIQMRFVRISQMIEDYLNTVPGTLAEPASLHMQLPLDNANWSGLLGRIQSSGKFVALNLYFCSPSTAGAGPGLSNDGKFDPDPGNADGKIRIASLVLPEGVKSIVSSAFTGCTNLKSIMLPDSIVSIDNGAFNPCGSLAEVFYSGVNSTAWSAMGIGVNNAPLTSAMRYYYSEIDPGTTGTHWRYVFWVPAAWGSKITYSITMQNDGNGTAAATPNKAGAGELVTISAAANSGYQFKQWVVVSGGVMLLSTITNPTTFTMLSDAVMIRAEFDLASFSTPLSIGVPSAQSKVITPIDGTVNGSPYTDRTAAFTVALSGFTNDTDANNVGLNIQSVTGLSFSGFDAVGNATGGTKTFTITVTYNGTTAFTVGSTAVNITGLTGIPAGYEYTAGTQTATINIADGAPGVAFASLAPARRIPVTKANIQAFNGYADTIYGRDRHYLLTENILQTDLRAITSPGTPGDVGSNWTAIGTSAAALLGSFDGGGNTITGLTINASFTPQQGMFTWVWESGRVQNLGLIDVNIVSSAGSVGGIVGVNRGTVINCYVSGNGMVANNGPGGFTDAVGGVIGQSDSLVSNCYAIGNISVSCISDSQAKAGGVIGLSQAPLITSCFATVNVASNYATGGVVGFLDGSGVMILDCYYASGTVTGNNVTTAAGGICGFTTDGIIKNCYATGNIESNGAAGGISSFQASANNFVLYNVGLNSNIVIGQNTQILGRVVGGHNTTSSSFRNYGRNGMTLLYNMTTSKSTMYDTIDGADGQTVFSGTGPGQYNNQSFWEGLGWDFSASGSWMWNPVNNLPVLRNMPGSPAQNHVSPP